MPRKKYAFEFWAIPKFVAEDGDLTSTDKLVMGIFITRWNGENDKDIPAKQKTLARQLGVSERQIRRSLNNLITKKLLDKTASFLGKKLANRYKVKI